MNGGMSRSANLMATWLRPQLAHRTTMAATATASSGRPGFTGGLQSWRQWDEVPAIATTDLAGMRVLYSLERIPVMLNPRSHSSWPGLSRPSTPYLLGGRKQDVDARDKRGHDERHGII